VETVKTAGFLGYCTLGKEEEREESRRKRKEKTWE
jgi:hypothetical protein